MHWATSGRDRARPSNAELSYTLELSLYLQSAVKATV